jgi:choline monooxygenase
MTRFTVEPDIAAARTIAKDFYLDPAVFALARERVFARSWQWLGRADDVATPGSVAPRELLPGLLDEPLLLARDHAGTLRALANVCTHRGMVLVDSPCRTDAIRCPYHGRRFDLAGRALAMPGFDGVAGFPSPADHLAQVAFASWHGHGFASLDPDLGFDPVFAPIEERLPGLAIGQWVHDPARSRRFEFAAHWALYVENYLEGLHIPFLHPGLARTLDLADYRHEEVGPRALLQLAIARAGEPAFSPPPGHPDHGLAVAAWYVWVFPNLMLNLYPWGLSLNLVQPLGPARTRVIFESFVADASLAGRGAGGALDPVEREDEAAVVSVQRGIGSRFYDRGRYAPAHERGVHRFHRLLAQALASG